jgi:hypothetical protein
VGVIDGSILSSWYNSKAGILDNGSGATSGNSSADAALAVLGGSSTSSGSTTSASAPTTPTPPWIAGSGQTLNALVQSVLNGGKFIDPSAAKLNVLGSTPATTQNYKNLFALYQGLSALGGLARQASATNVGALQQAQLQKAFQAGLQQVQGFLDTQPFSGFQVFKTNEATTDRSTATIAHETDSYTGAVLYSGQVNAEIPAFQNAGPFTLTVTKFSGTQVAINFDFSEMGSTPRTMANVLAYLNGKMKDAGVATRFSENVIPGAPQTVTVGGKTVTLSSTPNQYALQINGTSVETLNFSAPTTHPGVYVGQAAGITAAQASASGSGASSTKTATADAVQQLLKYDASSSPVATTNANGQIFNRTLDPNISSIQATATAPDGSVYVLADVTGTIASQAIQGSQDVALIKYDSAGNVVYTRTLGAPFSASGYGLAISSDGSQVAVTGSTGDKLDPTSTSSSAKTPAGSKPVPGGFVTVYSSAGDEEWTQQFSSLGGTGTGVQPSAVAFGPNDMVYVAGQTDGTIPGGAASGNIDGFVVGFHAISVPLNDGSGQSEWIPVRSAVQQFGTSGVDRATGLAVSAGTLYVSSVENGHAVVRAFAQSGTNSTSLTQTATRDLGSLQGGNVAGVAVNSDGSVVVAGSTHNGALAAGTVTQAYNGGEEAFVASLSADLQPASSDHLTYVGGSADQSATAMTVSGGQVYLTGQITTAPQIGSGLKTGYDGYAAAVDPVTGQVTWTQRYSAQDKQAAPTSIAVSQAGASALDILGLPGGTISYAPSQLLVANTSLRPGDQFFIRSGLNGVQSKVTIDAQDTLQTLAKKIERASGFSAKATVIPGTAGDQISITSAFSSQQVEILPGPSGADALQALGLQEGVISANAGNETKLARINTANGSAKPTTSLKNGYSLQLPSSLDLNNAADIKQALSALTGAVNVVKSIYSNMTTPPPSSNSGSSTVPKYMLDQIANYQAALSRLTGQG